MRYFLFILIAIALARPLDAQSTWIVGPGGFTDLDSAHAAAAPGDLILVNVPTTFSTLVGKGVRIIGASRPRVTALAGAAVPARIGGVPAGQTLYIAGLQIELSCNQSRCPLGLALESSAGAVLFDGVAIDGNRGSAAVDFVQSFHVENCSNVHFHACELRGQDGVVPGPPQICGDATSAVDIAMSTVSFSGGRLRGGNAPDPFFCQGAGGSGLSAVDSTVSLVGTDVLGGRANTLPLDIRQLRSTVIASPCPAWTLGDPLSVLHARVMRPANAGAMTVNFDPRPLPATLASATGNGFRLELREGPPNAPALILLALEPAFLQLEGSVGHGALLVSPGTAFPWLSVQLDRAGRWSQSFTLPPGIPALLAHQFALVTSLALDGIGTPWAGSLGIARF